MAEKGIVEEGKVKGAKRRVKMRQGEARRRTAGKATRPCWVAGAEARSADQMQLPTAQAGRGRVSLTAPTTDDCPRDMAERKMLG